MNQLMKDWLASFLRHALSGPVAWLVAHQFFDQSAAEQFATVAAGYIVAVLFSLLQKVRSQKEKLTAAAMPKPVTLAEVKAAVKAGQAPSVRTTVDEVPELAGG